MENPSMNKNISLMMHNKNAPLYNNNNLMLTPCSIAIIYNAA